MPTKTIALQEAQLKQLRNIGAGIIKLNRFVRRSEERRIREAEEASQERQRAASEEQKIVDKPSMVGAQPGTGGGLGLGSLGAIAGLGGIIYLFRDEIKEALTGFFKRNGELIRDELAKIDIFSLDTEGVGGGDIATILGFAGLIKTFRGVIQTTVAPLIKTFDGLKDTVFKPLGKLFQGLAALAKPLGGILKVIPVLGQILTVFELFTNFAEAMKANPDLNIVQNLLIAVTGTLTDILGGVVDLVIKGVNKLFGTSIELVGEKFKASAIGKVTNFLRGGGDDETPRERTYEPMLDDMGSDLGRIQPEATPTGPTGIGVIKPAETAVGQSLVDIVKGQEGFSSKAFSDYKQISIGYGTRARVGETSITEEEASKRLVEELGNTRARVIEMTTAAGYNFSAAEIDALTSFAYNTGLGKRGQKGGLANLLFGDKGTEVRSKSQIADMMLQYNKAGGEVLAGLTSRRQLERELFLSGNLANVSGSGGSSGEMLAGSNPQAVSNVLVKQGDNVVTTTNVSGGGGGGASTGSASGTDSDNQHLRLMGVGA